MDNEPFFYAEDGKPLFETAPEISPGATQEYSKSEMNRILVFRHIESTEPTTRYRIAKETKLDKTTVRLIVRDLVFAGIVHERKAVIDERESKILTIPVTCQSKLTETQESRETTSTSSTCELNEVCGDGKV